MHQIDESIWTIPAPVKLGGWLSLNTRMTVIRLANNSLLLHSPVSWSSALQKAIQELGEVNTLIAPNLFHHLYIEEWMKQYPGALSFGATGFSNKRPDLSFDGELNDSFDERFDNEISRIPILGMPKVNESLFFHHLSGTLIVTDFSFFMPNSQGMTALYASLMKFRKKVHSPLLFRLAIANKTAFRNSLVPLRKLEIKHLSMCHHSIVSEGAKAAVEAVLDALGVPMATAAR